MERIGIFVDGEQWDGSETFDETVSEVKMWYDRHERSWRVWAENAEGYQIGDAYYVYSKQEAIWVKNNWEILHGRTARDLVSG